jgi:glycogen debranching enzyme
MAAEIKVGPPNITISQGRTFMLTDPNGEIAPESDAGIFASDTRYISGYRLFVNQRPWKLLTSSQIAFYAASIRLTNPPLTTDEFGGEIAENTLGLTIDRTVGEGVHEDLYITNYSGKEVRLFLELALEADFADIFEVRQHRYVQRDNITTMWHPHKREWRTAYDHEDFHRAVSYEVVAEDTPVGIVNGRIRFDIRLGTMQQWHTCAEIVLEHGQHIKRSVYGHRSLAILHSSEELTLSHNEASQSDFDERQRRWRGRCTSVQTPNDHVYRMCSQAVDDMGALRIYDLDVSDMAWVPAGGVPWYVTLFGRDSLIVSLQNMSVAPEFARGALTRLAEYQAKERDDWRDAQPGKILHEVRVGELVHFHKIPFTPYYGAADATILYPIVLAEAYRWTGGPELLASHMETAEACLQWIDRYGDLDGDGFQEYKTFSSQGFENMHWKDSLDSVVYGDGAQVKQPKATCELQGYVYDAKRAMAQLYHDTGNEARAQELEAQAETLKRRFNTAFWMDDEGCFAYGLDPHKRQINSVASDAGHCLWSGIADEEKARRTMQRLLQPDMWSGWGVRTISDKNPAYNPYSYHLGSVWPHDNGIIAAGMKRYGHFEEANTVIRGIFDAARAFDMYRLPELFAGLRRLGKRTDFPVLYPGGANIPQAWASGSIFHMMQTILGLRADAGHGRLYVAPTLPRWLPDITLQHLTVGPCTLDLHFWQEGTRARWEVLNMTTQPDTPPERVIQVEVDPACAAWLPA